MKVRNLIGSLLAIGTLALSACGRQEVDVYTIEQRGSSPARQPDLILSRYSFDNDEYFCFRYLYRPGVRPSTVELNPLGQDFYRSGEGDWVTNLFARVKELKSKNSETLQEWVNNYEWSPHHKKLLSKDSQRGKLE